jgi:ABC-2 type transport system permease protein
MNFRKIAKGIYALWYREFKVFLRERSRIISSIFMPLFWYFIFGGAMGSVVDVGGDYRHFIFPGFLAMTIIFSSMFNGAYVVWDKKIDFLKEVLITPLSRTTIFFGKALGGITDSLLQACILLIIGVFLGIPFNIVNLPLSLIMLFSLAVGLVSFGLIIGAFMESPEGFGLVSSFAVYPLFLLSGALYPLDKLPTWMKILTHIDPAAYAVDGLRGVILGTSAMPYIVNLGVVVGFDAVLVLVGAWAFNRMKL